MIWPSFAVDLKHEGWKLKGEAMQDLNSSIGRDHVTENTVAAVAYLAIIAVSLC